MGCGSSSYKVAPSTHVDEPILTKEDVESIIEPLGRSTASSKEDLRSHSGSSVGRRSAIDGSCDTNPFDLTSDSHILAVRRSHDESQIERIVPEEFRLPTDLLKDLKKRNTERLRFTHEVTRRITLSATARMVTTDENGHTEELDVNVHLSVPGLDRFTSATGGRGSARHSLVSMPEQTALFDFGSPVHSQGNVTPTDSGVEDNNSQHIGRSLETQNEEETGLVSPSEAEAHLNSQSADKVSIDGNFSQLREKRSFFTSVPALAKAKTSHRFHRSHEDLTSNSFLLGATKAASRSVAALSRHHTGSSFRKGRNKNPHYETEKQKMSLEAEKAKRGILGSAQLRALPTGERKGTLPPIAKNHTYIY
eukprot:Colp12_sorted_trinity150504_noHs@19051